MLGHCCSRRLFCSISQEDDYTVLPASHAVYREEEEEEGFGIAALKHKSAKLTETEDEKKRA